MTKLLKKDKYCMLRKNKSGFTVVEMIIIMPIALILVAGVVTAMIHLNNETLVANEKAKKLADINRALGIIEKDIALSNKILSRVALYDHEGNEIEATKNYGSYKPFLANSVKYGNISTYDNADKPTHPYSENQPRLILNRISTITNPDSDEYLKRIAHYKEGAYSGENCIYNQPVFYNVVYFIKNQSLYRRVILPAKDDGKEQDTDIYCSYTKNTNLIKEIPWQLPTCNKSDFVNNTYPNYCKAKDELLVDQVEMSITYENNDGSVDNDVINNDTDPNARNEELEKAQTVVLVLTSKIVLADGDVEDVISGRIVANKLFSKNEKNP